MSKGALKGTTIKQLCQWIKQSWSRMRGDNIFNSFKQCSISNVFDGSEDHLTHEEDNDYNEEDISDDDFQRF